MPEFSVAMSIGPTCRAKYYLKRHFASRTVRGVFDRQMTPASAFAAYLDRDFRGMFEFRDFELRDGVPVNVRYGTEHMHEFTTDTGTVAFLQSYQLARKNHDERCENTRAALKSSKPTLLVVSDPVPQAELDLMQEALARYNPAGRYVIAVPPSGAEQGTDWKGCATLWAAFLRPFAGRQPESLAS